MLDLGTQPHKRSTFIETHFRAAFKRIADAHPTDSREKLAERFDDFMESREGKPYRKSAWEYCSSSAYDSLNLSQPAPLSAEARRHRIAAREALSQKIEANHTRQVEREVNRILLDIVLPSGKALRDSTGGDCAMAGGWLSNIAQYVGANQIVGETLSESEVRLLFDEQVTA